MRCPILSALLRAKVLTLLLTPAAACQAALFYHRPTFELGSQSTTAIDFEGLAGPPAYYQAFPSGLLLAGVQFAGEVAVPVPQPALFVIDPLYHTDYNRGSGDVLSPGNPDGTLSLQLPAGVRAVGFDVVTFGAPSDNTALVVASSGGGDPLLQFGKAEGPLTGRAFVGFTSDTPIARITVTPSSASILLIDNVRFGQPSSALVAGDANGDGWIDADDYSRWADNFLQVGRSFDQGDFNADGIVDGADYTLWADNFAPHVLFQATTTPEPSTFVLVLAGIGTCLLAAGCRGRRSRGGDPESGGR